MKIALASFVASPARPMQELAHSLESGRHTVLLANGQAHLPALLERERPDLLLLECCACSDVELDQVEALASLNPSLAIMLLGGNQTPQFLLRAMRIGVREVLTDPINEVDVLAAVQRLGAKLGTTPAANGRILAFVACKGGAGATFIATNLGFQLAQDKTVLLIDLNLQFGDALACIHDESPTLTLADVAANIKRMDATYLEASTVKVAPNFSVLAAPEEASEGMEIKAEHVEAILELAVSMYDFVLLDMPRRFDPVTIRALDRADRIYPVLQADLPGIRNAGKFLHGCRALGYSMDRVEAVLNRHQRSSELSLPEIRRVLGATCLRTVPNCYRDVSAAVNRGSALMQVAGSSAVVRQLADFAASLHPKAAGARSLLGRLLRRA